ncbi:MAG: mechanosensitive ion channel [Sulfolobales archaeon]
MSASTQVSPVAESSKAITRTVVYVVLYVVVSAIVQYVFASLLPSFKIEIAEYSVYAQILIAVAFGYLIVTSIANVFYWLTRAKYDHPTAAAIRNVVRIVGIGALAAAIAGGVAGGVAGVALGGFLGIVIGFASQQVLGQAIAGLFLLIARPFKIGDKVVIAGEDGVVEDVATLFTVVNKADGVKVLIPNSAIIGGKIYLKPKEGVS